MVLLEIKTVFDKYNRLNKKKVENNNSEKYIKIYWDILMKI